MLFQCDLPEALLEQAYLQDIKKRRKISETNFSVVNGDFDNLQFKRGKKSGRSQQSPDFFPFQTEDYQNRHSQYESLFC